MKRAKRNSKVAAIAAQVKKEKALKKAQSLDDHGSKNTEHSRILKNSLAKLVKELLPIAVEEYKDTRSQGKAYVITNMLTEIRGIISQIENSIDEDRLGAIVSKVVTQALRGSITRQANQILIIRNALPHKVNNSSHRRSFGLLLDQLQKDYEQNIVSTISDIESRLAEGIREVLKGKSKKKRG